MRLLLDTHALLWWMSDDARLTSVWRETISDPDNDVLISAVSVAEISIKASLGTLDVPDDLTDALGTSGFDPLPLTWNHAIEVARLPWHHRDPFDRMIIAQARVEGLAVATVGPQFRAYDVALLGGADESTVQLSARAGDVRVATQTDDLFEWSASCVRWSETDTDNWCLRSGARLATYGSGPDRGLKQTCRAAGVVAERQGPSRSIHGQPVRMGGGLHGAVTARRGGAD